MCCKFSSDGRMAASGSDLDNCLNIWDAHSGQIVYCIPGKALCSI